MITTMRFGPINLWNLPKQYRDFMSDHKAALDKAKGKKFDEGKLDWTLLPFKAVDQVVRVLMHGAEKYGRDNWRKGMDWSRLIDATLRHVTAFNSGETRDQESGCHHLAHARCCLAFLLEYGTTHPEKDDRATSKST